jgi:hypothetical protein
MERELFYSKRKANKTIEQQSFIFFEFSPDNTFVLTGNGLNQGLKGIWKYALNRKIIQVIFGNEKNNVTVISLKENELTTLQYVQGDQKFEMKTIYIPNN